MKHHFKKVKKNLITLFEQHFGSKPSRIEPLPISGSNRLYYRIIGNNRSVIGTFNIDRKENIAFINFSKHFKKQGMPVPNIFTEKLSQHIYLQEDLGNLTLFDHLVNSRNKHHFPNETKTIYQKVLDNLVLFQTKAGKNLNYADCYPRASFDKQSMMWDLNYFKYYFLKLAQIPFDEQLLEDDYQRFSDYLLNVPNHFFLYRDFQSRNIMLPQNNPYFIDYQGGRKGPLQYDLASLLFDAKADIPQEIRNELLDYYIVALTRQIDLDRKNFVLFYYGFVMIRIMQAMGAYGFRGFYERKTHFLKSIPYALKNMQYVLRKVHFPFELPELTRVLLAVSTSNRLMQISQEAQKKLHIEINSFSYRRGIPIDKTENGGGFVFDCRSVENPNQYKRYKQLTGNHKKVKQFFKEESNMHDFLRPLFQVVDMAVKKYLHRNYTHLQINFGCTGGQHRSVYAAEEMAAYLRHKYDVITKVRHREREFVEKN